MRERGNLHFIVTHHLSFIIPRQNFVELHIGLLRTSKSDVKKCHGARNFVHGNTYLHQLV